MLVMLNNPQGVRYAYIRRNGYIDDWREEHEGKMRVGGTEES